jgi:hypothetical protein
MKTISAKRGVGIGCLFVGVGTIIRPVSTALASPTPEEISRSFTQSMQQAPDYWVLLPWLFAFAGCVAVVIGIRQWQKHQAMPRVLNHPGKLVKEMVLEADLNPVEMKKLKSLARELDCEYALTLLLCPSLMEKPTDDPANR